MKFIADFHIHSKYSRATSPRMVLKHLDRWAQLKGIKVLGTGDFTHPDWLKSLKEKLMPVKSGLFKLKNSKSDTHFVLTTEISCIYSKKGRVRKIHIVLFSPSFKIVEKINTHLGWIGNLKVDGRPILGLDAKELAKIILNVSENCLIVPAHVWTPWFSLFGSRSGFDSIEECFEDYSKYIYALETGLSSSPDMNWRLSALDKITLISNSDAHSPEKIGREANVFDTELNYSKIIEAIKSKDPQKFLYTIEFFPQEGKYHYDGHRDCGISLSPQESKKYNGICPVCGKPLTIGVLSRVEQLSDRPKINKLEGKIPYKNLIPLEEIIAESLGITQGTKQVQKEYKSLVQTFDNEFEVLLNVSRRELEKITFPEIAEGIIRAREGKVFIAPGYDGVYGEVKIFSKGEQKTISKQETLF
jgi:DNA helicase-2/ATP-dependent DNA helicase PcrA